MHSAVLSSVTILLLAIGATAASVSTTDSILQLPSQNDDAKNSSSLQNASLGFPPPSRIDDVWWFGVDKGFKFGYTQPDPSPSERNVLGALVAAENSNLHDYRDTHMIDGRLTPIDQNEIVYELFGVRIYFDNNRRKIAPVLMGDLLQFLAQWILTSGKTAFVFSLVEGTEFKRAKIISNGGVKRVGNR